MYDEVLFVPDAAVHGPTNELAVSHKNTAPGIETSVVNVVLLPAQIVVLNPAAGTVIAEDGEGLVPTTAVPVFAKQDGDAGFLTHIG
jgi:hypothetical protein